MEKLSFINPLGEILVMLLSRILQLGVCTLLEELIDRSKEKDTESTWTMSNRYKTKIFPVCNGIQFLVTQHYNIILN